MNHKLYHYLHNKYLCFYILTLPFSYINTILPAIFLSLGGWVAEHPLSAPEFLCILVITSVSYYFLGHLAAVNKKQFFQAVHTGGQSLRIDLMKVMVLSNRFPIDHSLELNDVEKIESHFFSASIEIIEQLLLYIIVFIIIFLQNPFIAIYMSLASLCVAFLGKLSKNRGITLQAENSRTQAEVLNFLSHTEQGYDTIQIYKQQKNMETRFQSLSVYLSKIQAALNWGENRLQILAMGFLLFSGSSLILIGNYCINIGKLSTVQLLAMIQLSNNLFKPIKKIVTLWYQISSTYDTRNKIVSMLHSLPEAQTNTIPFASKLQNTIQIDIPSFYFNHKKVLYNIHFHVKKGEKILIAGPNGCGKSTLLKSILGEFEELKDCISIDTKTYSILRMEEITSYLAPVSQSVFLYPGTVHDNLTSFRAIDSKTLPDILKTLQLSSIINEQNTEYLSGGQKQRIAIARALLSNRTILLLDEAFSAIDIKSQNLLENYLLQLSDFTILSISHRLSLNNYLLFHKVIFMDNGTFYKIGSPQELINEPFIQELLMK